MNKNFKNMSIGAVASAIAGAYYLYGSRDGEAKRKQITAWSIKMKGEILEKVEKLKEVSEPKYKEIVKAVSAKYKQVETKEMKKVVDELHSTWGKMKKEVMAEIAKRQEQIAKENAKLAKGTLTPGGKVKASAKPAPKKQTSAKKKTPAVKSVKVKTTPEATSEVKIENK